MIKRLRLEYPIPTLCRILTVSVSGYYSWSTRKLSRRAQEDQRLEIEIQAAHKRTRKTYNSERLQEDLAEHGITVGVHRIRRIRKKLGIRCIQNKKFKATTNSNHNLPVAENLLDQNFDAKAHLTEPDCRASP